MGRILKDIPELVQVLDEQQSKLRDLIVPSSLVRMDEKPADPEPKPEGEQAPDGNKRLVLSIIEKDAERTYGLQEQVHAQLASKLGIHGRYYSRMREEAVPLLLENVNYWLKDEAERKRLVRLLGGDVRAVLSDRYRPISHYDVVRTAVQIITGRDGNAGVERPWARGAKCFGWRLTPTHLDVCLVNPGTLFDLKHPDNGVQQVDPEETIAGNGGGTDLVYAGRLVQSDNPRQGGWFLRPDWGDDHHMVFPSCRIRNSETGHGGLYIQPGIYEAVCDNTAWIGTNLAERHLGRTLEEDDVLSPETYRKMNAVIFSKTADVVRSVFEPAELERYCRKFLGLLAEEIEVKEAAELIVKLPGMTEEIGAEILKAYRPVGRKDTAFDLQRAVTAAARDMHATAEHSERAYLLEELGGDMIERGGMRAIASPRLQPLQVAA
jgi:hypothetical protein